jgi:hypothetical protein
MTGKLTVTIVQRQAAGDCVLLNADAYGLPLNDFVDTTYSTAIELDSADKS